MTNHQKRERALELYNKGYTIRQIAKRINVQYPTAKRYVDPEYDQLLTQRNITQKKRYAGTCEVCGGPTSYSGKKSQGARYCKEHVPTTRIWTRENIIEAIQKWAEIHGRPPSSVDWNAALAKDERGPEYPAAGTVYGASGPFDSWADAIEAAGFPRPAPSYAGKHGKMYWTKERIIETLIAKSEDGVAPASTSWHKAAPDRPTGSWVTQQFGSWAKACHEAGLVTQREHKRDKRKSKEKKEKLANLYPEERLAFIRRVMDDHVPRSFLIPLLWRLWGFRSADAFSYWLGKNDIREFPGRRYQTKRHLSREELEEARMLALPPAVRAKENAV